MKLLLFSNGSTKWMIYRAELTHCNINLESTSVFTDRQLRQAALKAANRIGGTNDKPVEIRLRERETKKVHILMGWKELVRAPKIKPDWMPTKINKPFVKKIGTKKIEKLYMFSVLSSLFTMNPSNLPASIFKLTSVFLWLSLSVREFCSVYTLMVSSLSIFSTFAVFIQST